MHGMEIAQKRMGSPVHRKGERSSNLELYRVIVMLLIVAHHYVVNSGLTAASGPVHSNLLSLRSQFLLILGAFGKSGINCFVMLTGYFMCTSHISLKKYCKLLFQIQFYRILLYIIFLSVGRESASASRIIAILLPVTSVKSNFIGCFILFYLLIPFLNVLIRNLTKMQHFVLVLCLLAMHTGMALLSENPVTINYVAWFCVIYLLAAYIRLHPGKYSENTQFWLMMTLISLGLSVFSVPYYSWIQMNRRGYSYVYLLSDCHKLLAVTNGLCSFMLFKSLRIPYSRTINCMGAATFGVLLIHSNSDAMRTWLWRDLLKNVQMYTSDWMPLHAIACILGVYAVCTGIELLRIKLVEKPLLAQWDAHEEVISRWCRQYVDRFIEFFKLEE